MTDREMLELAAKAAGYDVEWQAGLETGWMVGGSWWNPLTDDGDALRLAVRLNLHVGIDAESAGAITVEWDFDEGGIAKSEVVEFAPINGDDFSATRRAIVRAAAEIGRAMP